MGPELKYKIKQNKPSTKLCVSFSKSQTYVTINSSLWKLIFHQNIILCMCLGKAPLEYLLHIVNLFFKNQLLLLFQMRLIAVFFFFNPYHVCLETPITYSNVALSPLYIFIP